MTAEIVEIPKRGGKAIAYPVHPDYASGPFAFQRALIRIELETIAHINAGRTFQAIFTAAALVPLAMVARSLGPVCVARAIETGERMKAALDASVIGDDAGDATTFDNQDDPA